MVRISDFCLYMLENRNNMGNGLDYSDATTKEGHNMATSNNRVYVKRDNSGPLGEGEILW